jgi:hypothetical protein
MKAIQQSQPWHQRTTESDEEFAQFLSWLMSEPRKAPKSAELARRNNWSDRAVYYESYLRVKDGDSGVEEMLSAVIKNMIITIKDASFKLREQQLGAPVSLMSMKDLVMVVQLLADLRVSMAELLDEKGGGELDLSSLTDEQLATVGAAQRILKGLAK